MLPFVGLAALIVLTPGPDLMLVTRSVLAAGRRAGLLTAFGIAAGAALWALAATAGLATLLSASPDLLVIIRLLGAGYLGWLGLQALLGARSEAPAAAINDSRARRSPGEPFRAGLISNLLHPGQIVFYTSLLPQFIDPAGDPAPQVLTLGTVFVAIVLAWFSTYAVLASCVRLRGWERLAPLLTRVTGVVLIGFAVRLAVRV